MRKNKQFNWIHGLAAALAIALIFPTVGFGQQNDAGDQSPALSSLAQVAQAEHQAAETAARHREQLRTAVQAEIKARKQLQAADQDHDAGQLARAEKSHRATEQHAVALMAQAGGITTKEIAAMRNSGMGWGQIAESMGIQPGQLGLGRAQGAGPSNRQEMTQAAERNVKQGRSTIHGHTDSVTTQGPRHQEAGPHNGIRSNSRFRGGMGSHGGIRGGRSVHGGGGRR